METKNFVTATEVSLVNRNLEITTRYGGEKDGTHGTYDKYISLSYTHELQINKQRQIYFLIENE